MFTYSNGYWEVYRHFQGDFFLGGGRENLMEGGYVGGSFHGGICHGEENFNDWGVGFSSII